MTPKEVTNILYNLLENAGFIEEIINKSKSYHVYKSSIEEKYMVCLLNEEINSHSDVLDSIEECYNWIEEK
jgi:hypothetical protein